MSRVSRVSRLFRGSKVVEGGWMVGQDQMKRGWCGASEILIFQRTGWLHSWRMMAWMGVKGRFGVASG